MKCPNFFFNTNLHTFLTAHFENSASADFAKFHENIFVGFSNREFYGSRGNQGLKDWRTVTVVVVVVVGVGVGVVAGD
jgi:hypothetical protein